MTFEYIVFFFYKMFFVVFSKNFKSFFCFTNTLRKKLTFQFFSIFILLLFIFIYLLVICQFLGCMCLSRNVIVYVYVKVLVYIYKYVKCQGLFHLNGHHNVTVMLTKKNTAKAISKIVMKNINETLTIR